VFIVELQWNPGLEHQAIARAIRLGQKNEVHVTRYVIKDTVEEVCSIVTLAASQFVLTRRRK
jgi:hypothetical protein